MRIKGIKKVCSKSLALAGRNDGCYLQLNYDMKKHKVFTDWHCSFDHNSYTRYHDENIIFIAFIDYPMMMKDIEKLVVNTHRELVKDL